MHYILKELRVWYATKRSCKEMRIAGSLSHSWTQIYGCFHFCWRNGLCLRGDGVGWGREREGEKVEEESQFFLVLVNQSEWEQVIKYLFFKKLKNFPMGTYKDQSEKEMNSGEEKVLRIFGIIVGITWFANEFALPTFSNQILSYCLPPSWQSFLPW